MKAFNYEVNVASFTEAIFNKNFSELKEIYPYNAMTQKQLFRDVL